MAGEIRRWDYEWITFVLAFDCRWTPWVEEDARIKLRVAGTHFPFVVKAVWWDKDAGAWVAREYK